MMEGIRYASYKAKTEPISYRHDNQDKTPGLVSFQKLLTKRVAVTLYRHNSVCCRRGLKVAEYAADIEVTMKQVI